MGSATYAAKVWINGTAVGEHMGGHLPFTFDITSTVNWGEKNRISIQIENILKPDRVAPGNVNGGPFNSFPSANYDFFPYAGLNRPIWLFTIPAKSSIRDITLTTDFENSTGYIQVEVEKYGNTKNGSIILSDGEYRIEEPLTFSKDQAVVTIEIPNVKLWSPSSPFLYNVEVSIIEDDSPVDMYTMETGVRTVSVTENEILLNGNPLFLKGFGKHEDFPIFGRGSAYPVMVKDYELMKWTGANSFRTSHYPYDEEFYKMADREGFLIIDETPSVGLFFNDDSASISLREKQCKRYIEEMISRDKNHPSVIMWCVANEPFPSNLGAQGFNGTSQMTEESKIAEAFLSGLIAYAKELDSTRLVTFVGVMGGPSSWMKSCDIIAINRYWGWYTNVGDFSSALKYLEGEMDMLHSQLKKPVIITEFGADAIAGMHALEDEIYSEEYQTKLIKSYLDIAETKNYVAGMHVWNFADFRTGQSLIRVGGMNLKGVFTRDRKPKQAAHYLRSRWNSEMKE